VSPGTNGSNRRPKVRSISLPRYVLIPASEKTHGHFTHFYAEVWKPYLIEFMKTLGAMLGVAAEDADTG